MNSLVVCAMDLCRVSSYLVRAYYGCMCIKSMLSGVYSMHWMHVAMRLLRHLMKILVNPNQKLLLMALAWPKKFFHQKLRRGETVFQDDVIELS